VSIVIYENDGRYEITAGFNTACITKDVDVTPADWPHMVPSIRRLEKNVEIKDEDAALLSEYVHGILEIMEKYDPFLEPERHEKFMYYPYDITPYLQDSSLDENSVMVIGYKKSMTGIGMLEYYESDQAFCSISKLVIPSAPTMIYGQDNTWISEFDDEATIFPGLIRYICESETGKPIFKIRYVDRGIYKINECIDVYYSEKVCCFWRDKELIGSIRPCNEEAYNVNDDLEEESPEYRVRVRKDLSNEEKMLIEAFPYLLFGL